MFHSAKDSQRSVVCSDANKNGYRKVQPPKPCCEAYHAGPCKLLCIQLHFQASIIKCPENPTFLLKEMREIQRETSGEIMAEALEARLTCGSCNICACHANFSALCCCRTTSLSGILLSEGLQTLSLRCEPFGTTLRWSCVPL